MTASTLLLLVLSGSMAAAIGAELQPATVAGSSNKILFLQVHLEQGQMTVLKSTPATGVLKSPRQPPSQRVMYSLEATNGASLWSGWMEDPTMQRIEYPDDSEPGVLRAMMRTNDPVDFVVRIPQTAGAEKLSFYRLTPASGPSASPAITNQGANSQTTANANMAGTVKELMGSVVLPKNEK